MTVKFTFDKSYEELEINGTLYVIHFSDEAIMQYQQKFNDFQKVQEELKEKDVSSPGYIDAVKEAIKEVVDTILGAGKFDVLYLESGKSLYNMMELIDVLSQILGDKFEKLRNKNREKYVKK